MNTYLRWSKVISASKQMEERQSLEEIIIGISAITPRGRNRGNDVYLFWDAGFVKDKENEYYRGEPKYEGRLFTLFLKGCALIA